MHKYFEKSTRTGYFVRFGKQCEAAVNSSLRQSEKAYEVREYCEMQAAYDTDGNDVWSFLAPLQKSMAKRLKDTAGIRYYKKLDKKPDVGDTVIVTNPDVVSVARGLTMQVGRVAKPQRVEFDDGTIISVFYSELTAVELLNKTEESVNMKKFYAKRIGATTATMTNGKMYEILKVDGKTTFTEIPDSCEVQIFNDKGNRYTITISPSSELFEICVEGSGTTDKEVWKDVEGKAVDGNFIRIIKPGQFSRYDIKSGDIVEVVNADSVGDVDRVNFKGEECYIGGWIYYNGGGSNKYYQVVVKKSEKQDQDTWTVVNPKRKAVDGDMVVINKPDRDFASKGIKPGDVVKVLNAYSDGDIDKVRFDERDVYTMGYIRYTDGDYRVVEKANRNEYAVEVDRLTALHSAYSFHFVVNEEKRTVTCERKQNGVVTDPIGKAKCNPQDTFDVHKGKWIALYRSMGMVAPETLVTDGRKAGEFKVGDVVILNTSLCYHGYDNKVVIGKTHGVIKAIKSNGEISVKFDTRSALFSAESHELRLVSAGSRLSELPKIGDYVKVVDNTNAHNYETGSIVKVSYIGIRKFRAIKGDVEGNNLLPQECEAATKEEYNAYRGRPTIGNFVKVIDSDCNNYTKNEIVKISVDDGSGAPYRGIKKDGTLGNWITQENVEWSSEKEYNEQEGCTAIGKRPTTGDYVKLKELGTLDKEEFGVGDVVKIVRDDKDTSPYRVENGAGTIDGYVNESDVEMSSQEHFKVSERPTVGDIVEVLVEKDGLDVGKIAKITTDDRDNRPYQLGHNGKTYSWFTPKQVRKLTDEEVVALAPTVGKSVKLNVEVTEVHGNLVKIKMGNTETWIKAEELNLY